MAVEASFASALQQWTALWQEQRPTQAAHATLPEAQVERMQSEWAWRECGACAWRSEERVVCRDVAAAVRTDSASAAVQIR